MPELRKDPILDRWTIIAQNRAQRPNDYEKVSDRSANRCPFCEGHEDLTPPEVHALRTAGSQPNATGWNVRIVPNKYPALISDSIDEFPDESLHRSSLYRSRPAVGAHEVIVESPQHIERGADLPEENYCQGLQACRDRLLHWKHTAGIAYAAWFKNVGELAGATLRHLHSQLLVLPIVPVTVREELSGSEEFFQRHSRCVFCEMIDRESSHRETVVCQTADFLAFCPFASRFAFETWILPRTHASHFENVQQTTLQQLALVMRHVLVKLESALEGVAYNVILHSAPFDMPELSHYHWHMEILPRLTRTAGFEWSSGFAINPVTPKEAARRLKVDPF